MGAVYKARDREVDRFVALKIIRPELASRPDILARFKQELILARQVTHKNVIRIFDLGEADGMKFITMDFVEGQDLKTILREKGKFAHDEAVKIITQICRALDAAHTEGVIHRDLKPQNIMVDAKNRVTVMDFGIARSLEMTGMTQTGSLVGTPEYMSPEQAKGEDVDARSDLFMVGIIFYELLTGKTPFHADTTYATLLKRTQERARPPIELEPGIPPQISSVVMKCLETDREQRYSSALDIVHDLGQGTLTGSKTALSAIAVPSVPPSVAPSISVLQRYRLWLAAGAAVIILAIVGVVFRAKIFPGAAKHHAGGPTVSLLILPLRNASGDSSIDWMGQSLAEMLRTDVGQSESFRSVPPDRLHQILKDLRVSADTELDPSTIRRISEFTNADQVVSGQYVKLGDQIRVDATLENLKTQKTTPIKAVAENQKSILDQLAKGIQDNLTLSADAVEEMKASAFTPSSKSVDALRDYSEGLELSRQGNYLEATKKFQAATTADSQFALAYTRLAQAYSSLGHDKEAEQWSSKAVDLSNGLPPAEKYMIQAFNVRVSNNYDNAVQTYNQLLKLMPNDAQVHFEIASVYEGHGSLDQAREHFLQALQADPKYIDALLAVGRVEIGQGNPQGALDHLNQALSLTVQLGQQQGKANILQIIGTAYYLLNRPEDALQNLQQAYDIAKQLNDKGEMAQSLSLMAGTHDKQGKSAQAEKEYREALKLEQDIGDQAGIAQMLINVGSSLSGFGKYDEAIDLTKQALKIEQQLGYESAQAFCLNSIGQFLSNEARYDDALAYFQQALDLRQKLKVPGDIALVMNNMGDAYGKLGQYDKALDNYLHALDLSRSAGDKSMIAAMSDSMATLFEAQGRYGAALSAYQEALKNVQELHQQDSTSAQIQADYGNALALVGRFDEAQKNLDAALALARSLKADPLIAQILNFQGERLFYGGDIKSARPLFEQAVQIASHAKDRENALEAKFNLARLSVYDGHASLAATALKNLVKDADAMGHKYLSTECSLYLGIALVQAKNYSHGQPEIEDVLRKAQDAEMKSLLPQAHYWVGVAMRANGDKSAAATHFQQASKVLEEMRQESHSDAILKRADLMQISEETRKTS
jgi:eukaryotic-like serine/threonine-protein kinase